jgi:DNA-binding Lrp family transcriptional regulator
MVCAVILVKADIGAIAAVAEKLVALKGVSEVMSVAGRYDLVAIVRVRENEEMAQLVSGAVRSIEGIASTETLIAFRVYSQQELDTGFDLGIRG